MHIAYDQVAPEKITYYSPSPKAAISDAIPPVTRKRTLAALQKKGKEGSLLPFAAVAHEMTAK